MKPVLRVLAFALVAAAVGCSSGEKKDGEKKEGGDKPKVAKKTVAESDVPKVITDSWAKSYPGGKANAWTEKGGTYAVRGVASNHWVEVKFSSDGTVKESAEELAPDGAPASVKAAFAASSYAKMTFIDGYRREAPDNKDYPTLIKFVLKDGEKPVIAVYKLDGTFVKDKTIPADKFQKWQTEHTVTK